MSPRKRTGRKRTVAGVELDDFTDVTDYMYEFAVGLLAHGIEHVVLHGRGAPSFARAFGIHHVVHGTELLGKAAIAMTDPTKIFTDVPRARPPASRVTFEDVVRQGRTIGYSELPQALLEVTGFRLSHEGLFREVGRLRNAVQHFVVPNIDCHETALTYACSVTDPLLRHFWSLGVFEAIARAWDEEDPYLIESDAIGEALERAGIAYDGWLPTEET